jgi:transcriptional regulator
MYDRSIAAIDYFTDDEIDFALRMYAGGHKQKEIAACLGTYVSRISRMMIALGVDTRRSWDYVTSPVDRMLAVDRSRQC